MDWIGSDRIGAQRADAHRASHTAQLRAAVASLFEKAHSLLLVLLMPAMPMPMPTLMPMRNSWRARVSSERSRYRQVHQLTR